MSTDAWRGVGLLLYGTLVISTIDNVIKPIILREAARIHPLLGFLAILGGVITFGVLGFLIGPVVLSLLLSAMRIYRAEVVRSEPAPADSVALSRGSKRESDLAP